MLQAEGDAPQGEPNKDVLASKTVVGAVWLMGWRMFSRSVGLVSTLILARLLLPKDFGIIAMTATFSAVIDGLSQIGVQDALVRRAGDGHDLFDTAFTLQAGRGLITFAVLAGSGPLASWWFNEPRVMPMMVALGVTTFISSLENVAISEFRRSMRYSMVFSLLTVPRLVSVVVAITAALLLRNYWALLIAGGSAAIVRTVMSYIVHPYRPRVSLSGWRQLAGFSVWIWATSIVVILYDRIDVFLIGPAFGQVVLGLYIIAWDLGSLPYTEIVVPASDALFAGFSRARNGKSSAHHAPQVAAMLVTVVIPVTITISCGAGYVVAALLGSHWISARALVAIMAWMCLFAPLSSVCYQVLIANGHVARAFGGKAVAAIVKLGVLLTAIMFTRRIEFIAAAVTVCVAVESCAYLFLLSGLPGIKLSSMLGPMARSLLAGSLTVLVLWTLGLAWQPVSLSSPSAFGAIVSIGFSVTVLYGALVFALWFLAGRPKGPETRLLELSGEFVRSKAPKLARR